jgi:hypothetical protein
LAKGPEFHKDPFTQQSSKCAAVPWDRALAVLEVSGKN